MSLTTFHMVNPKKILKIVSFVKKFTFYRNMHETVISTYSKKERKKK